MDNRKTIYKISFRYETFHHIMECQDGQKNWYLHVCVDEVLIYCGFFKNFIVVYMWKLKDCSKKMKKRNLSFTCLIFYIQPGPW